MVTIGITGHRILTEVDRVEAGLVEVILRLEVVFPGPWSVVSALAEGADRLATRLLLERPGTRLTVVLPLARDEFEVDFETAASKEDFSALFTQAHQVVEIPPQTSRNAAYEAGGLAVLDRSDVLVAVWDGHAAQGRGGTGDIVAEARRRQLPIAWVHAGNRRPGTDEPVSLGPEQGTVTYERFPDR